MEALAPLLLLVALSGARPIHSKKVNAVEHTELWRASLGQPASAEGPEKYRQQLIAALETMTARSAILAGEIAHDLPDFTVHDSSHSAALWGLADRIAGSQVVLNPVEGFVFGAAALIHDLGMASAAYVDGVESLKKEPLWSDTITSILRHSTGRAPTKEEVASPGERITRKAIERILRGLHARHAEELATATWTDRDGNQYALLEDPGLRETLGPLIGNIAHSHWWPVHLLGEKLGEETGAPSHAPSEWSMRPLVLACLLRLADASHLDASRAPRFLRVLRSPSGESAIHWDFQERLNQPLLRDDRFVFTSSPFPADRAEAWWLCADTLASVDKEFRLVDSLLADRGQPRLAVRGVFGSDDWSVLAQQIPTDGWTPLDAKIRISNVVRLVERLGGQALYGSRPEVPLRELIQNGCDAVRARRVVDELADTTGSITVSIRESERAGWEWIETVDSGLGMSPQVLTDHLLDFGESFWESERVVEDFPGLLSSQFEPIGRFGIGFFSVFMWGDEVDVVSRRHDASRAETYILEFRGGPGRRPLLRQAVEGEQMKEPGTRVRVLLSAETFWRLGIEPGEARTSRLRKRCAWLAPALDVDLYVENDGERQLAVGAGDWVDIPIDELGERIEWFPVRRSNSYPPAEDEAETSQGQEEDRFENKRSLLRSNARVLKNGDGSVVGRLAIGWVNPFGGATVVGGLRATTLMNVTGILRAAPTTASRNAGLPLVSQEGLAEWASEQAGLLSEMSASDALEAAEVIWMCGGDLADLPIAETGIGPLSRSGIKEWVRDKSKVVVVAREKMREAYAHGHVLLSDDTIVVAKTPGHIAFTGIEEDRDSSVDHWPLSLRGNWIQVSDEASLVAALAEIIGEGWGIPAKQLLDQAEISLPIGLQGDSEINLSAAKWTRL